MNIKSFKFTRHAVERASQRGVTTQDVAIILDFGEEVADGYFMSNKAIDKAGGIFNKCKRSKDLQCLDHLRNIVLIAEGSQIVTIYRADKKRIRRLREGHVKAA